MRTLLVCMLAFMLLGCDGHDDGLVEMPIYRLTGVTVEPLDREDGNGTTSFFTSTTLTRQLHFQVRPEYRQVDSRRVVPTECDDPRVDCAPFYELQNPTRYDGLSLTLNQAISYRGRILPAGTDLMQDEEIVNAFDGSWLDLYVPRALSPSAIGTATFRREAFNVPNGDYRLRFAWTTQEGEVLADEVAVRIALKD
ncbi:MAG: hypothetical protein RhofKO_14390 [Rhodothermales bacterium]